MKSQHDQHISTYIKMAVQMNHNMWPFDLHMDANQVLKMCSICLLWSDNTTCRMFTNDIYDTLRSSTLALEQPFFQLKPPFSSGISQLAMFDYQRVYQPRGVGCHRVSYISSLSMTGLGGAHDITTMVQHVWTSSPDKNSRAGTKKWSGPTMTAASQNNDVEANVSTHSAGHSFHIFQHKIYEQMDNHGIGSR